MSKFFATLFLVFALPVFFVASCIGGPVKSNPNPYLVEGTKENLAWKAGKPVDYGW